MKFRIPRPSAALVVAILALVIAMTGSAVAVVTAQGGDTLIKQRSLSGNRLRYNTVTSAEVANLQWHNLTLINGWKNYNGSARPPAWALDAQGIMHLRGAIYDGSITQFARLPLSVRPSVGLYLTTNLNNAAVGRVDVFADGFMQADYLVSSSDAQAFTNLEGVTWAK